MNQAKKYGWTMDNDDDIPISSEARRNQTFILYRAEKITFPPKPDGWTDSQTYGRTLVFIE